MLLLTRVLLGSLLWDSGVRWNSSQWYNRVHWSRTSIISYKHFSSHNMRSGLIRGNTNRQEEGVSDE